MAKPKHPIQSLEAHGTIAKSLTFQRRSKTDIVRTKPTPTDRKTQAQLSWRHMYQKATALWHALSAEEQWDWQALAGKKHMTGFAYFMSLALKPNPGLYLPLQGGIMQGDIDMNTHKVTDLPDPTAKQDAATKAYIDQALENMMWAKFLNDTPSGIGAYYEMAPEPTGEVKSTFTSGVLGTGDDQALFQWISDAVVSFTTIKAGVLRVHIHAQRTAGNKSIKLYAQIYEYSEAAAETLIATTELCDFLTDDEACIEIHAPLAADYEIAPTSKLLIKFLANVGAAGANVTLNLYAEGQTTSSVSLPIPTSPLVDAEIAFHASIAAAHHARYTNAEAVAAAKTVKLDDFTAPDDTPDLNSTIAKHGLLRKLANDATKFLNGLGNWTVPPGAGGAVTSGTYTGNGTENRAIPHGLGLTPKIVLIIEEHYGIFFRIHGIYAGIFYQNAGVGGGDSVTIPNATNFYVGNSSGYAETANYNGSTYHWVAIG